MMTPEAMETANASIANPNAIRQTVKISIVFL